MKNIRKLICMLFVALIVVSPFVYVDAKTTTTTTTTAATSNGAKVKIYVFYGSTCPHCEDLHEYLDTLEEDDSINYMFEIVDYEVWGNETNNNLMLEVGEYFETTIKGVPFYVIGSNYYSGYGESSGDTIVAAIKQAYEDDDYKDIVAGIGTGEIDGTISDENDTSEEENNNRVGMIILGITVVLIIIFVISSSKNEYYDYEDDDDEENHEKVQEEKILPKNTTKKEKKSNNTSSEKKTSKSSEKKTATKKKTTTTKKPTKKK